MDQQIGNVTTVDGTCAVLTMFTALMNALIPKATMDKDITTGLEMDRDEFRDFHERDLYDFIVVGGGTAGSVVAARLSENPAWNVLLLEAGCEEVPFNDIPVFGLAKNTRCQWNYTPVANRRLHREFRGIYGGTTLVSGMILGGSSTINGMIYDRGQPADYDKWARKVGDPSWSFDNVLRYFKKSEGMTDSVLSRDTRYHSTRGPMGVSVPNRTADPIPNILMETFREFGYPEVDQNAGQIGASVPQYTYRNGRRSSTYRAFLEPARFRPNLFIKTHSRVTQIILNQFTRQAVGVQYIDHYGHLQSVYAEREVIVSAGVFETPHLLMLSGIGPATDLVPLGIPVVQDLPVGRGLRDHLTISGFTKFNVPSQSPSLTVMVEKFTEYLNNNTGPFSYPLIPAQLFEVFSNISFPDWEFMITRMHADRSCPAPRLDDNVFYNILNPSLHVLHPKSVGQVRLRDADPLSTPIIDFNYLAHQGDLETAKRGIRSFMQFRNSHVLRQHGITMDSTPYQGCEEYYSEYLLTDEYLECVVRSTVITFHNHIGSCAMGRPGSRFGVVDSNLRVHGINGLRIVDASVIPVTLSGYTNAAVIMVAEKASDLIKSAWARWL